MDETNHQLLEEIAHVRIGISNLHEKFKSHTGFESPELGELFTALAKAQTEMEVAKTDTVNTFLKSRYAPLSSLVKASRPFLAKNGLAVIQRVLPQPDGVNFLYTRLCHTSGQWMESKIAIVPPKGDIQTMGSYITYLRRYCYASMVGVVSSDEDDDGQDAMTLPVKNGNGSTKEVSSKISKAQLEVLAHELQGHEDILETLLNGFNISKMADIEAKHFYKCVERIKQIKLAKEEEV